MSLLLVYLSWPVASEQSMVGGSGFDAEGDYAHGLFYVGSEKMGFQGTIGVGTLNGDFGGRYFTGGETYTQRFKMEYNFKEGQGRTTNTKWDHKEGLLGDVSQSENYFDETPNNNVDLLGPEFGFEWNFFELGVESFKAYVRN